MSQRRGLESQRQIKSRRGVPAETCSLCCCCCQACCKNKVDVASDEQQVAVGVDVTARDGFRAGTQLVATSNSDSPDHQHPATASCGPASQFTAIVTPQSSGISRYFKASPARVSQETTIRGKKDVTGAGVATKLKPFNVTTPIIRENLVFFDIETSGLNINTAEILQIGATYGPLMHGVHQLLADQNDSDSDTTEYSEEEIIRILKDPPNSAEKTIGSKRPEHEERVFSAYCLPVKAISADASRVNKITINGGILHYKEMPVAADVVSTAMAAFIDYLEGLRSRSGNTKLILVGHNVIFDARFLLKTLASLSPLYTSRFSNIVDGFLDSLSMFRAAYPDLLKYSQTFLVQSFLSRQSQAEFEAHNALSDARYTRQLYLRKLEPNWSPDGLQLFTFKTWSIAPKPF